MLTEWECSVIQPTDKTQSILDSNGLYLKVTNTGRKIWRVKFFQNGKRGDKELGEYPELSLDEARFKRDELKASLIGSTTERSSKPLSEPKKASNQSEDEYEEEEKVLTTPQQVVFNEVLSQLKHYINNDVDFKEKVFTMVVEALRKNKEE